MSVLAYPPANDEDIFRQCTKDCGMVTATDDFQYFTLRCIFCSEKFMYFDAFIGHMQTMHLDNTPPPNHNSGDVIGGADSTFGDLFGVGDGCVDGNEAAIETITATIDTTASTIAGGMGSIGDAGDCSISYGNPTDQECEDLTDTDPTALMEPEMVIKQEMVDELADNDSNLMVDLPPHNASDGHPYYIKQEHGETAIPDVDISMETDESSFFDDNSGLFDFSYNSQHITEGAEPDELNEENQSLSPVFDDKGTFPSYDEMVEESLLGRESELTMHIKDRKMIQFLIVSYHRNPFLWDHRHPQFRDRVKRQRFLDWIVLEFKRRFNISLAKDAITRKWDNLRTVYKRECNRMALERTNISTLWYFKELHFLSSLYSYDQKLSEAVVQETSYRRRFSAIWNDVSTNRLLTMVKRHQCFYNRYDLDYRSKEKRGEALQQMAAELQSMIDVSTIQISKRISQLRFDYSKQKMERYNCERQFKKFVPNYSYYDAMKFMDDDVPPFKCELCSEIVQTLREMDLHMLTHQPALGGNYKCTVCNLKFPTSDELISHKKLHLLPASSKETKYNCDLCTASFREKSNYEEHMRRHNDELLLPSLALDANLLGGSCSADGSDIVAASTSGSTTPASGLVSDGTQSTSLSDILPPHLLPGGIDQKPYLCEICHRSFASQGHLNAHRVVHADEADRRLKCDYPHCGKTFVVRQSLLEHVKMHYSDDEYRCDTCGKGFKSSKNLQNHKQIHDKVKRYVCQICGSAFAQAAGLYLHKRRHTRSNVTMAPRPSL